ncbi:hypothetical protein [Amycolatopsis sp. NPDC021455]|uniref:hypothetical protein n=1 Tax=Amycolatopsis sp. NPDC021455 TaxID=3154901 RepID=UPI0033DDE59F
MVDGAAGVGGDAGRDAEAPADEGEAGAEEEGAAEDVGTGAGSEAGGAATPSTGVPPHPAITGKEIANNTASVLRRIFPPAAAIRQNEAEP